MAKRFNIIRNIKEEIKKGNTYVAPNGNFVSADLLNNDILNQFKRELTAKTIDYGKSFEEYKQEKLSGYTTALDVMNGICEAFGISNDDLDDAEAAPDGQTLPDMPEPTPDEQEQEKPKRAKKKGADTK